MDMEGVVVSPIARDPSDVPDVSLTEFLLPFIRANAERLGDTIWMMDVTNGTSVKFCDIDDHSRRVASALTKRGFKKGDLLYFITCEMAHLYIIKIAVWRLGGTVRGWIAQEPIDVYIRHLRESRPSFLLMDAETAPVMCEASTHVDWSMQMLSLGKDAVPGATSFDELLQDDGSAYPEKVEVNPREDVVIIPSTSGSAGAPRGILHTHYTAVAFLMGGIETAKSTGAIASSMMSLMVNFSIGNFMTTLSSLHRGLTVYNIAKFDQNNYIKLLTTYKPEIAMMYPYLACWFSRQPQLKTTDFSFLRAIWIGAWVLDPSTVDCFTENLPGVIVMQGYGMSECMAITSTNLRKDIGDPNAPAMKIVQNNGSKFVSTGRLLPYVKAKVIDPETKRPVARGDRGEILIHSPTIMKGCLDYGKPPNREDIDDQGWLHTGDLGFIDDDGNVFVIERLNFTYKYKTAPVSPCEIEAILQEHPSIQAAAVVGIPNVETDNLSRAYVVLKPGCTASPQELKQHVAGRLSSYMHLHGGVRFIDKLPQTKMGKLDRKEMKKIALASVKTE